MEIIDVIEFAKSCTDNSVKRYVSSSDVEVLQDGLNAGLEGNDLFKFLEDRVRGRAATNLMRCWAFCQDPSYENAHMITGNKEDATRLMKLA